MSGLVVLETFGVVELRRFLWGFEPLSLADPFERTAGDRAAEGNRERCWDADLFCAMFNFREGLAGEWLSGQYT